MHDGHNLVDPATASYGADWQVDEVAAGLIAAGRIEPILIVGAECTADRMEEYGDTKAGRAYLRFLAEDLKPLVDARYRTRPGAGGDRHHGVLDGRPDLPAGPLPPRRRVRQGGLPVSCLPEAVVPAGGPLGLAGDRAFRIYLDNGGVDLDAELQPGLDRMLGILRAKGFRDGQDLDVVVDPAAKHFEDAWAARVWRPLEFLFG